MARTATVTAKQDNLPRAVEAVVRRASVPPHLRTLFANLPGPLELDVQLPRQPRAIPVLVRQLVKLGLAGGACRLASLRLVEPARGARVVFTRERRRHVVEGASLGGDLLDVVHGLLQALFRPDELPGLLDRLAFQSATLATLQAISRHMLRATEPTRVHHAMLLGITAGYSLGFNRAVLFTHEDGRFMGARAVGPGSHEEAHRIWEELEMAEPGIDELLAELDPPECNLQRQVRALSFTLGTQARDEMAAAAAAGEPVLFRRARAVNPVLRELGAQREFVVAAVRARQNLLGFIFADNIYSQTPITPLHLRFLHLFLDQAALVWENLILLRNVEHLARHDSLTGLFNRREFDERLAQALAQVRRAKTECALLVIDLDHFKQINDQRGHAAGDEALRTLGTVLRRTLRTSDLAGRYGGDEFVVFLPGASPPEVRGAAVRLGQAAREQGISLSIGGAHHPRDCLDPAGLFAAADAALYRAKAAGRACACLGAVAEPVRY
ncbi:MAG: GGDEF domain-containing protein [Myxococcota bacterium]